MSEPSAIVDTSAVLTVLLHEPLRARILELTNGIEVAAPSSLPAEVGNTLSSLLKRRRLDANQALHAAAAFGAIRLTLMEVDIAAAVALSARLEIYAYDAYMIHAALGRGLPLITLDGGLANACRRAGGSVIEVK